MSGRYHRAAQGWKKEHPRVGGRVASLALQWVSDRTSVTSIALKSDILRARANVGLANLIHKMGHRGRHLLHCQVVPLGS